ncbi:unnamed protein product [Enterobius vermicularis]|uniref:Zinc transporter 2 n=1 Tax=Enterobius vermicularis TaxID=51028 RepID=A0A0N4V2X9_ENTVE|nr:unnamed protein product [Enterobius vermicularis]
MEEHTENTVLFQQSGSNYGSTEEVLCEFHCHGGKPELLPKNSRAKRVLWLSVIVCLSFMICEVIGGWIAQSLAIMTDAAHLLTDFASMLVSLFALYLADRPASQRMSFGWYRAEVLGAFFSVFLIWIVTGILVYMAVDRIIRKNYDIDARIMALTAGLGVLVNIVMTALLYFGGHTHSHGRNALSNSEQRSEGANRSSNEGSDQNINVRAAMVHVIGDMIQSIGVLVAAVVIYINKDYSIIDPICTLVFSIIVLCTTFYIIRDAAVVLLEGRPSSIDYQAVFESLENITGVEKVHDLRIWSLTLDKVAISVHLEISSRSDSQRVLKDTTLMLRNEYGVHESTVQIECYSEAMDDCNFCVRPD